MNTLKILALALLIALPGYSYAASSSDEDEASKFVVRELEQAKKDIKNLEQEKEKLNKENEDRKKKIKELETKLQEEKDKNGNGEVKKLKDTIQKRNVTIEDLKKRVETLEQEKTVQVSAATNTLNTQITKLQDDNTNLRTQLRQAKSDLAQLEGFRAQYLKQLVASFNSTWGSKAYKDINPEELDNAIAQYGEYAATDKDIKAAHDKLVTLKSELDVYDRAKEAISSKYDRRSIQQLGPEVDGIMNTVAPARKAELQEVSSGLKLYRRQVMAFKQLIEKLNEVGRGYPTQKAAYNMVDDELNSKDNAETIELICKNEWLKEQFDRYKQELKRDCLKPGPVQELIMGLQTN